jgi:hypothetical protein
MSGVSTQPLGGSADSHTVDIERLPPTRSDAQISPSEPPGRQPMSGRQITGVSSLVLWRLVLDLLRWSWRWRRRSVRWWRGST